MRNFIFTFLLLPKINQLKYIVELEKKFQLAVCLIDESVSAFAEMDEDEDAEITQEEFIKVKVGASKLMIRSKSWEKIESQIALEDHKRV